MPCAFYNQKLMVVHTVRFAQPSTRRHTYTHTPSPPTPTHHIRTRTNTRARARACCLNLARFQCSGGDGDNLSDELWTPPMELREAFRSQLFSQPLLHTLIDTAQRLHRHCRLLCFQTSPLYFLYSTIKANVNMNGAYGAWGHAHWNAGWAAVILCGGCARTGVGCTACVAGCRRSPFGALRRLELQAWRCFLQVHDDRRA